MILFNPGDETPQGAIESEIANLRKNLQQAQNINQQLTLMLLTLCTEVQEALPGFIEDPDRINLLTWFEDQKAFYIKINTLVQKVKAGEWVTVEELDLLVSLNLVKKPV